MHVLPLLPLKGTVVFPGATVPLAIGHERSIELVGDVSAGDRLVVLTAIRSDATGEPGWGDVYDVGTLARVRKLLRVDDGTLRILVEGLTRVRLERRLSAAPYLVGEFATLPSNSREFQRIEGLRLLNVDERQRVLAETDAERREQLVAAIVRREDECERLLQPVAETVYATSGLNVRSNCTHALFDPPVG